MDNHCHSLLADLCLGPKLMQLDSISSGHLEVEIVIHVIVDAVKAGIGRGGDFVET